MTKDNCILSDEEMLNAYKYETSQGKPVGDGWRAIANAAVEKYKAERETPKDDELRDKIAMRFCNFCWDDTCNMRQHGQHPCRKAFVYADELMPLVVPASQSVEGIWHSPNDDSQPHGAGGD